MLEENKKENDEEVALNLSYVVAVYWS